MEESVGAVPNTASAVQYVIHHNEPTQPHVSVDMERNSRGVTWGVHVSGAASVAQAMEMLDKARSEMEHRFGTVAEVR